jgi:hypothetical protein
LQAPASLKDDPLSLERLRAEFITRIAAEYKVAPSQVKVDWIRFLDILNANGSTLTSGRRRLGQSSGLRPAENITGLDIMFRITQIVQPAVTPGQQQQQRNWIQEVERRLITVTQQLAAQPMEVLGELTQRYELSASTVSVTGFYRPPAPPPSPPPPMPPAFSMVFSEPVDVLNARSMPVLPALEPAPAATAVAAVAEARERLVINTPPTITLITTPVIGKVVEVRQGYDYQMCSPGQLPTVQEPCEVGALAQDAEDGELTIFITVCPTPCNNAGQPCSPPARLIDRPPLSVCGFDTRTERVKVQQEGSSIEVEYDTVGMVYVVTFSITDRRNATASVSRLIKVVEPCGAGKIRVAGICSDTSSTGGLRIAIMPWLSV